MTLLEGVAAPGGGAAGMPTWDMAGVTIRRLAPAERLDGVPGAIWALVLDGDARLETAAGVEELHAGDAFHVDARGAHRLDALTPVEVAVSPLRAVPPLPSPLVARGFAGSNRGLVELVRMCPLDPRREQPLFVASYGGLIQAAMLQALDDRARQPSDSRLTALLSVLDAHPGRPWTVESMARVAHLSRSSLGERFRRELGRSPAQLLREVRMRHARALLVATTRPIEQIAFTVGYGSAAAFSRAFSAQHGSSPQAWRSGPGAAQCTEAGGTGQGGDGPDA
ncbi:AraC-type DNA-binding protein [Actinacidiphila yanglinensis]|uniref:AraC-type DNA-binding protein n=1 Tax=Actinacidiphila yanglinensis TaxID=310779 RepID=A0A1H6DDI6_9ACTN|nr:AraC family transcriptional regulator [Actinacidiphila yanglinensis]SEG83309.1 AraC-type DNA-binding protein [Actinacidiphila yanglinensis]